MRPDDQPPIDSKPARGKRMVALAIKLLVTAVCFWYIATKIDFDEALQAVRGANAWLLVASVVAYVLSKLVAAYRLNVYFQNIGVQLSAINNLRLYWLGMFYNLFLPGSISGDAYKVVVLRKRLGAPYKKTSAAVLLDRFSGLLGLGLLLSGYAVALFAEPWFDAVFVAASLAALAGFYWLVRKWFPEFLPGFTRTLLLGIAVQAVQVVGVYLILAALHVGENVHQWVLIFLTASVLSVLPISLGGGLGTRELVFAQGAEMLGLQPQLGVVVSLLFYLGSVAGSIGGAWYIFHDPLSVNKGAAGIGSQSFALDKKKKGS